MSPQTVVVRLADEGMPIRAIARSLQISSENIREVLGEAVRTGDLLAVPKDDWPAKVVRENRGPCALHYETIDTVLRLYDEEALILHIGYLFGLSPMQAIALLQFLRKSEVSRDRLHAVMDARRSSPGNIKIVDVVLWALRRKLKPFFDDQRVIVNVMEQGYLMIPQYRKRATEILAEHLGLSKREPVFS
jgi:DNA-binding winged helix-turn-helix (wHTH) protein